MNQKSDVETPLASSEAKGLPAPEPDTVSLPVAEFVQKMVDAFGALEQRMVSVERVSERRGLHIAQLTQAAKIQQAEIEKLANLNTVAFAKIADVLADLGVSKTVIRAALPPKEGMN